MRNLLTCASQADLHEVGTACAKRLGYDAWVYVAMPRGGGDVPYLAGSLPASWYTHHFKHGHASADPVFAHCRRHMVALVWNSDDPAIDDEQGCPVFFAEAADFALRHGVSVPLHGLGCEWGVLSVASTQVATPAAITRRLADLYQFAAHIHEAGHRLATSLVGGELVHLTERERECLRWTAEGKTGWEISKLLGISERTVVFHLENAARKFGVFGRRQAAARAVALQMISL